MHSQEKGSILEGKRVPVAMFVLCAALLLAIAPVSAVDQLDPTTIPKWENQISGPPPVYVNNANRDSNYNYLIDVKPSTQQYLPLSMNLDPTPVLAYGGQCKDAVTGQLLGFVRNSPGCTFEVKKNEPIRVKWVNNIPATTPSRFPIDPTLHWASPDPKCMLMDMTGTFPPYPPGFVGDNNEFGCTAQWPIPIVTHVHGAEVQSTSDGGPDQWFTSNGIHGKGYSTDKKTDPNAAIYRYPNINNPSTIWYHDHALGITRINVMSGLAGFYLIRDPTDKVAPLLPSGKYEVPLAIQDRVFNNDGTLWFTQVGVNPDVNPYWDPEFFGNTVMVNGLVWPNMNVDRGQYRFRLLDGSNARFYTLNFCIGDQNSCLAYDDTLESAVVAPGAKLWPFTQIGTDGGYLRSAVTFVPPASLTIAPGERADILVDFSGLAEGTKVLMINTAVAPFPGGDPTANADPATTAQVMQFTVGSKAGFQAKTLPSLLNPTLKGTSWPVLPAATNSRTLTLYEVEGANGPLMVTLNGQRWMGQISELPKLGSTEEWIIVDTTMDTHPIHTHLTQFQLVSRQAFDMDRYTVDWIALNGGTYDLNTATCTGNCPPYPTTYSTKPLDPMDYLIGNARGPAPNELGWKDTIQMNTEEVTKIRIRFSPQDGRGAYPFDATQGPGYVWHCHIIDHEDNEMMRPYMVVK